MSVKLVTPDDAARDPKHPEHARWVKDQTLAREAQHAAAAGLSFRDAETINAANLARLERRKRIAAPKRKRKSKRGEQPRNDEHARLAAAGVIKRPAPPQLVKPRPSPCNWCGLCVTCKREARLRRIMREAREGDYRARGLVMELVAMAFAAQKRSDYKDSLGRELPFSRLQGRDRARATTAGAEWVCDRSAAFMGDWR